MPRVARNQDEIDEIKDSILDGALSIIIEEGYDSFTMRKLGSALGCAAKTIYNYFILIQCNVPLKLERNITLIYQPTNAHIISHKTHLKHFKTLRHV